jgi:hypothetical protein
MGDMPGAIRSVLSLCAAASFALIASPASPVLAGESGKINGLDYWGTRDALYQRVNLIAELEANPDVDDAVKGPQILAARAEIHRLRAALGPVPRPWLTPCCYRRRPLYLR